ncbi:hypothetical protein RRG08_028913 [Elysia crispata]|uniref:Uncharacterized protein n=1 Tax=Elysia crispata TaxID=231223 RepID=A0AAE1APP6_9GAST|nr:hypothetical protein RRG08_028913 [Elysia crispata]
MQFYHSFTYIVDELLQLNTPSWVMTIGIFPKGNLANSLQVSILKAGELLGVGGRANQVDMTRAAAAAQYEGQSLRWKQHVMQVTRIGQNTQGGWVESSLSANRAGVLVGAVCTSDKSSL